MATLEKIRSKAGLLVGVVGIALFAFIIGDFLREGSTFFRQSQEKVVVVNGHSIGIQEFQRDLETALNNYRGSFGGSLPEEQQNQIRQMVFDRMVGSILLNEASKRIGFVVTKEELADLILGNNISPVIQQIPWFQNSQTGMFDRNSLVNFLQMIEPENWGMYPLQERQQLQNYREIWLNIEHNVAEQQLAEKFSTLISSAIATNNLDAKAAFNDARIAVDFDYVTQSLNSIPDSEVEVSDAEVARLYELRKQSFTRERAKVISYIAVNIVPSTADFADISTRIENLREEFAQTAHPEDLINDHSDAPFLDAYVSAAHLNFEMRSFVENASIGDIDGPVLFDNTYSMNKLISRKQASDSIRINQITFPALGEETIKSMTDSLIRVIRSGRPFADVAIEITNGQSDGDMGWQTEASLVQGVDANFANALFEARLNDLFTVNTSFGTHLIQVVERTRPVTKYKVGTINMRVTPSQETYNQLYNSLNQFLSRNRTLEQFQSTASEAGFVSHTGIQVLENQSNIAFIENSRQVVRWAFSRSRGAISDIFECQDYFIAAAVEGEIKAGVRPIREVSDILRRELLNERKGARIVENLKALNLISLDEYAEAMNATRQEARFVTFATPRITGIGLDAVVNARAVRAEVGELTEPFAGTNGVYVLLLTAKTDNEQEWDEITQRQQMDIQGRWRIMSLLQNQRLLKEKAKIEDNRSRFF
jgi:peptidyl-prolyl cis-trans isomerase D